jgi:hypothetical protein
MKYSDREEIPTFSLPRLALDFSITLEALPAAASASEEQANLRPLGGAPESVQDLRRLAAASSPEADD